MRTIAVLLAAIERENHRLVAHSEWLAREIEKQQALVKGAEPKHQKENDS